MHKEMKIKIEKAGKILEAFIYQEIIDDTNKEVLGEKIEYEKPLIDEFVKFCGLSDEEYNNLYDDIFGKIDKFEGGTFWENFVEKIAIVKREEVTKKNDIKFSQDEAFEKLCEYMDEINNKIDKVNQTDLWKYIAQYFK
jgi:polyhydroxyalkanoate synthesis regulator phasin